MSILVAAQRAERDAAIAALEAALSSEHASVIGLVISRYSGRKAALSVVADASTRAAEMRRLVSDETAELARLAVDHAGRLQRERRSVIAALSPGHRAARQALNQGHRRQRMGFAIALHSRLPSPGNSRSSDRLPIKVTRTLRRGLDRRH